MKIAALITAKGNSERIPNKNKIIVAGNPLYTYTVKFIEKKK